MDPGLSRALYLRFMKRMMVFWWLIMPIATMTPLWNAVHQRPDERGLWVGYLVLAVPAFAMWLYLFKVGRVMWKWVDVLTAEDAAAARERKLKERLTIIRAERLERAEARLARIHAANEEEERAEIAADLLELRDELD